jgi:methyltransferase (TIGR00027 family)
MITAAARAVESNRPDPLFTDDLAAALAGPEGFTLLERYEHSLGRRDTYLPARTRHFDDLITHTVHAENIRQVALLGAGLDTRAYRLEWPQGVVVFEIDQGELLEAKNTTLTGLNAHPRCDRRTVPADLTGDWTGQLRACGYQPTAPCLWIAEGLLVYLDPRAAEHLLAALSHISAPDSHLAADLVSKAMVTSMTQVKDAVTDTAQAQWRFGVDEPESLFARCGWALEQLTAPYGWEAQDGTPPPAVFATARSAVGRTHIPLTRAPLPEAQSPR